MVGIAEGGFDFLVVEEDLGAGEEIDADDAHGGDAVGLDVEGFSGGGGIWVKGADFGGGAGFGEDDPGEGIAGAAVGGLDGDDIAGRFGEEGWGDEGSEGGAVARGSLKGHAIELDAGAFDEVGAEDAESALAVGLGLEGLAFDYLVGDKAIDAGAGERGSFFLFGDTGGENEERQKNGKKAHTNLG